MGIFKSFENFAPTATYSADSIEAATAMYEAAASCEAIANQLSAILDDYKLAGEIMVAGKKDSSEAFKAFVGDSLRAYASTEEAKDTRTFWTKVKEFFVRLWHSVQDFFAKFSVFASAMKSKLDKLNIRDIAKGVDKDLRVEPIKIKMIAPDKYEEAVKKLMQNASVRPDDQAKLSEASKILSDARKEFSEAMKNPTEVPLTIDQAEEVRKQLSQGFGEIIKGRAAFVAAYKQAVDNIKGGLAGDEVNKKLRINALKDQRHNSLMAILTISKQLIKDSKTFISAVKKMKKQSTTTNA